MAWKIMKNQTGYPLEILVDEETILLDGEDMDAALPLEGNKAGTIVYNADLSTIKLRDFDGTWEEV